MSENIKEHIDYAQYMNAVYYWDYIYKSNHMLCFYKEELDSTMEYVELLKKYNIDEEDKTDYFTIRNIIAAFHNAKFGIKTTFPLEKLSAKELYATEKTISFCINRLYYPWDIEKCPAGESIAIFVCEYNNLPYAPPILVHNSETRRQKNNLTFLCKDANCVFSEDFKEEMRQYFKEEKQLISKLDTCKKIEEINIQPEIEREYTYWKQTNELSTLKFNEKKIPEKKIQKQAKLQKQIEEPKYRGTRSLGERIMGLILWETALEITYEQRPDSTKDEQYKYFDTISISKIMQKIEKNNKLCDKLLDSQLDYILEMNERNYQRWYKVTKESIQQSKFVSISIRKKINKHLIKSKNSR